MNLTDFRARIKRLCNHLTADGLWFLPGIDPNEGPTKLPVYTQSNNLSGQTVLIKVADIEVNVAHITVNFAPCPPHFMDNLISHLAYFKG